jgi:cytochrome c biogenesis protein ResB
MKKQSVMLQGIVTVLLCLGLLVGAGTVFAASKDKPVNIMLKNNSSSSVQVEMLDMYGGNVTVTVQPGTSQNHAVKLNSAVKVGGKTVLQATAKDEGKEVVVGG